MQRETVWDFSMNNYSNQQLIIKVTASVSKLIDWSTNAFSSNDNCDIKKTLMYQPTFNSIYNLVYLLLLQVFSMSFSWAFYSVTLIVTWQDTKQTLIYLVNSPVLRSHSSISAAAGWTCWSTPCDKWDWILSAWLSSQPGSTCYYCNF